MNKIFATMTYQVMLGSADRDVLDKIHAAPEYKTIGIYEILVYSNRLRKKYKVKL